MALILMVVASLGICENYGEVDGASHGFRLQLPDGWSSEEKKSGDELRLVLSPGGGSGRVRAEVLVSLAGSGKPDDRVAELLQRLRGEPSYPVQKRRDFELAGRKVPGVDVVTVIPAGERYRAWQFHARHQGFEYTLKCYAPEKEFGSWTDRFHEVWAGFRFVEVAEERRQALRVRALAGRCGSELRWAADWESAAARARSEGKPVLVYLRFLGGFQISDALRTGPFMDREILDLIEERFVPVQLDKSSPSPLGDPLNYGLGPLAFGSSLLVATPAGRVVEDLCIFTTVSFDRQLREVLDRHPEWKASSPVAHSSPETDLSKVGRAEAWLRRGEPERARRELGKPETAREYEVDATILAREWKGEAALESWARARSLDPGSDPGLEEALLHLRLGRFEAGQALLDVLAQKSPGDGELLYWQGAVRLRTEGREAATEFWRRGAERGAERKNPDRWSWRCAGSLLATGLEMGVGDRLDWPPEEVFDALRVPSRGVVRAARRKKAMNGAVKFLLENQLEDGAWACTTRVGRFSPAVPDALTDAVTAICARSLVPYRSRTRVARALDRALDYLDESEKRAQAFGPKTSFMDHTVWRNTYVLWFLADAHEAGVIDESRFDRGVRTYLPPLLQRRRATGGWSYYVTMNLSSPEPSSESITFTTAAVLRSLRRLQDVGVEVPPDALRGALDSLELTLNSNGAYDYFHRPGQRGASGTDLVGAAGRAPVCTLALLEHGRSDLEGLRSSLDVFAEYVDKLAGERGKTVMHAGPGGLGCHYLLFDYAFAADSVARLPRGAREPYRRLLTKRILETRLDDGSFLDTPLIGRVYGTGMALQALQSLESRREVH